MGSAVGDLPRTNAKISRPAAGDPARTVDADCVGLVPRTASKPVSRLLARREVSGRAPTRSRRNTCATPCPISLDRPFRRPLLLDVLLLLFLPLIFAAFGVLAASASSQPGRSSSSHRSAPSRPARPRVDYVWNEIPLENLDPASLPSFRDLGLPQGLIDALAKSGVASPFPIQAATSPTSLAGRDVLGRAATGSGKTLAFGLPLIARLDGPAADRRAARAVWSWSRPASWPCRSPTRSRRWRRPAACRVRLVAGGLPIQQADPLPRPRRRHPRRHARPADRPDRAPLLHPRRRSRSPSSTRPTTWPTSASCRSCADLLDQTPAGGQRLLFSATLDGDVATLVEQYLTDPAVHARARRRGVGRHDDPPRVPRPARRQVRPRRPHRAPARGARSCSCGPSTAPIGWPSNCGRLGVAAGALHGGRTQSQRTRALDGVQGRLGAGAGRHRCRRPWHPRRRRLARAARRPAGRPEGLPAPLGSHRARRAQRHRRHAGHPGPRNATSAQMLGGAAVTAATRPISLGDAALADLTGARMPSGVPSLSSPRRVHAGEAGGAGRRTGGRPALGPSVPVAAPSGPIIPIARPAVRSTPSAVRAVPTRRPGVAEPRRATAKDKSR